MNPHITPTGWLLLGLITLCALCLFAVFIGHCINSEWRNADEPIYRTADGGVLSADARAALRKASKTQNIAHCTGSLTPFFGDENSRVWLLPPLDNKPKAIAPNLQTTHRQGTAAALSDMGLKPGTPPTPNPHGAGTLAHFAWRAAYERTSTVCNGGALS